MFQREPPSADARGQHVPDPLAQYDTGPGIHGVPGLEKLPLPVDWTEDRRAVRLLDQTLLPEAEEYLRLESIQEVAEAICALRVRGAPAIGIAAALGLAAAARRRMVEGEEGSRPGDFEALFHADVRELRETRPTAVNLAWALGRMSQVFAGAGDEGPQAQVEALVREADAISEEDRAMGRLIGIHGAELIPGDGASILTHCNAGALATGGVGTALAPVYVAHGRGVPVELFADETRPLLQGARLTAWEASRMGIPVTVATDSTAATLMARGEVDLVLVGADRVAGNGDVANKIGTYGLAVLARYHGIPFFVALPRSTFDPHAVSGHEIPIEERDPGEVRELGGRILVPEGARVRNPAFDITPAHLVTAFITDGGVLRPPFGPAIQKLLASPGPSHQPVSHHPESHQPPSSMTQEEP